MCKRCGDLANKSVRKPVTLGAQDIHSQVVFASKAWFVGTTTRVVRKLYGRTPHALCTHKEFVSTPINNYLSTLSTPLITMTTIYI